MNSAADKLTQAEQEQLYAVLLDYADVFAVDADDLGKTDKLQHTINTGSTLRIRQPPRRVPAAQRDEVRKLLNEMEQKGIIQPSKSPWASPVVLVKKKDGSTRFCVDYRKLNSVTHKDAYPLPRIDDTLQSLSGSKWFSTIDLLSGYWQVGMAESDKEKTAFITRDGLFEFNVMPFGLCNGPAMFQRLMNLSLSGMLWSECLVYLDNIIIFGCTFEEHLCHLTSVLERLRAMNLKAKLSKCNFLQQQVLYLGHVIFPDRIATDPSKTERITGWPTPQNVQEVQRFLGLASYYWRFVQNFAAIARPLHRLNERGRAFNWTVECENAFVKLKLCLRSSPILAFPDFSLPFILDTDACQCGIGVVLSQIHKDGIERVVVFASRAMSKSKQRYSVTRQELLAAVTFIHHFRQFLLGQHFVLRTDHGSLQWLHSLKEPEGQLARWLEHLQEYDFDIQYRKGNCHQNADALSRHPTHQAEVIASVIAGETMQNEDPHNLFSVSTEALSDLCDHSIEELRQLQQNDDTVGPLLKAVEDQQFPTSTVTQGKSRNFQLLLQQWRQLYIKDRLLFRRYEDCHGKQQRAQLVVPESLKTEVLDSLHGGVAGGHLGEDKTLSKLWERFYWPGHTEDVRKWCQGCPQCAQRKTPVPKNRAKLTSIYPGYPLQLVAVDILGPLPESCHKNSYVLVVVDYFTKWTEAYALPNQEATTVARKLVEFFLDSLSHTSYIQTREGSLSQPLSKKFVVYYRLTRQELHRITHSLTAW